MFCFQIPCYKLYKENLFSYDLPLKYMCHFGMNLKQLNLKTKFHGYSLVHSILCFLTCLPTQVNKQVLFFYLPMQVSRQVLVKYVKFTNLWLCMTYLTIRKYIYIFFQKQLICHVAIFNFTICHNLRSSLTIILDDKNQYFEKKIIFISKKFHSATC